MTQRSRIAQAQPGPLASRVTQRTDSSEYLRPQNETFDSCGLFWEMCSATLWRDAKVRLMSSLNGLWLACLAVSDAGG
jgi:hypothetical protein